MAFALGPSAFVGVRARADDRVMPGTLGEALLAAAATHGPAVAFQMRRHLRFERTTYTEAALRARRVAAWFVAHALHPGDRIAVRAPNMPEYALLYFGAWLAGLAVVPIDARTRPEVVARVLAECDARILFTSRALPGGRAPDVETYDLEDLLSLVSPSVQRAEMPHVPDDALAAIVYTSGTTADPKGVMLTHANLLAEIAGLQLAYPLRPGLVALSVLPLSHVYELTVTFLHGFTSGIRMTFVPRVNAVTIARAMAEAHVEAMTVVPELLRLMLRGIERRATHAGMSSRWTLAHRVAPYLPFALRRVLFAPVLRALGGRFDFFGVGGAPLDIAVARAWERLGVHVFEGYGLTESSAGATINSRSHQRLGSAGRAMPNVRVRCGPDGEIEIAGPTVSPGYFGDERRTAAMRREGWLRTGDVGRIDDDGYLFITGRVAFRIVLPDGRKVYPEDVERELNVEAAVRDSCVVGLRDEHGRERVHAVLLGAAGEAEAVVRSANARLADHQQIRTWSVWPEADFPRGPTLKPDRAAIRDAVDGGTTGTTAPVSAESEDPLIAAVARASGHAPAAIRETDALEPDLGLDSVARIELLSILEEEMGVALDELRVGPALTVAGLREIVRDTEPQVVVREGARWPRSWWARLAGDGLIAAASRMQDHWLTGLEVVHPERIAAIPTPSLIVFNYQAPYAALLFLRSIPRALRHRIATAADAEAWSSGRSYQGALAALAVQGFPLVKTGGASRDSLIEATRWIDDGYAVLLAPEGGPSMREETGPFLNGVGMLAVELAVPVVPIRIEGYAALYPRHHTPFPWLPEHRGRARLVVGEPFCVPAGTSYAEATDRARRAVLELR